MQTTDFGPCEWFVWDLHRSNLIDREQLDPILDAFLRQHVGAEPPSLAQHLIGLGLLTPFQAERLLQGKTEGFVLGPFTLLDALGVGSMGAVYKAQSKNDGRFYAVKVLPRRSMWNVRVARRKVRLFEQCRHPAVVPFVDVGTSAGLHYLAWPLVEGEPLDQIVKKEGRLSPVKTVRCALQTAEGLELCAREAEGLFHGLLKPSNLMIAPDGGVRILDFGIGCLLAETEGESLVDTMSTANSVNSGLDCTSPESIMEPSNQTAVGDQYSLGCVMYFCLAGQLPFPEGTAVDKMTAHQFKQPRPLKELAPDVPDGLIAAVERLMQKDPAARYADWTEVIAALRPFAPSSPAVPRPRRERAPEARPQPIANGTATGTEVAAPAPSSPVAPAPSPREPPVRRRQGISVLLLLALGAAVVFLCLAFAVWLAAQWIDF
ncbi:MAG TPA: protein kinase [Gemmataceae bacterium]|nr:protein kinase [Gemmataceae bacterium]